MGSSSRSKKRSEPDPDLCFTGEPIPADEAIAKWPFRYSASSRKTNSTETPQTRGSEAKMQAKTHYRQAKVDGVTLYLGDDVFVMAGENEPHHIAKIDELFEGEDDEPYFRCRWFYRPQNTVIEDVAKEYVKDKKLVFLSNVYDDNPLNCIYSKVNVAKIPAKILSENEERVIPPCDFYYNMKYEIDHLTFKTADDDETPVVESDMSTVSSEDDSNCVVTQNEEKYLLDLYSGCGAMSTGLCMGASYSGVKLITKWAVDINAFACKSLKLNHPETEVRNETAENFLCLLKEWRRLCLKFALITTTEPMERDSDSENEEEDEVEEETEETELPPDEFEVGEFLSICFGDPNKVKSSALHFKVRWKGYGPAEDTWEPYEGIRSCKDKLREFVTKGFDSKLLPLPGDAHTVCGGPPCQGISGFNRFRESATPFKDEKNRQLLVYMDIIEYLKPKYILMENVVDLVKFAKGFLVRYAIARLVTMSYQTRLGIMTAGSYGVAQCRDRVFLWGSQPTEKLPPYPLPTHEVNRKSDNVVTEFGELRVGYDQKHLLQLEKALTLEDAIRDLPEVSNAEAEDKRKYTNAPKTDFQKYIRIRRADSLVSNGEDDNSEPHLLYDHQPLKMNDDDYERSCNVPKRKGANYRDFGGIIVENKTARIDPSVERKKLKSGKNLIPDYAISFVSGKSTKPFGRVWWDEIISTVVTRAEPHNQRVLHPLQDRVLSVRENARLQGFPDFYMLTGTIKEKYTQVGNAVAVPVGFALGYAFGLASQGLSDSKPVIKLPFKYPECLKKKE